VGGVDQVEHVEEQGAAYAIATIARLHNHITDKYPFSRVETVQVRERNDAVFHAADSQIQALLGQPVQLTHSEWPATRREDLKQLDRIGDKPGNSREIGDARLPNQ